MVDLDAFLPGNGDSSGSLTNDDEREWFVEDARRLGDAVDLEVEHVPWDTRHDVMHDGPGRVLELLRDL